MKKIVVFLIPILLLANSLDKKIVELESKIYPKIIFLDYKIEKKLVDNEVLIHIIYDTKYHKTIAEFFKDILDNKIIYNKKFNVKLVSYQESLKEVPTAYIVVLKKDNVENIEPKFRKNGRLIFSFKDDNIKYSLVSLFFGAKVLPIVNLKLLKEYGIELKPIIFKVAEIYNENDKL
ncbi:hypothetical protein [Nitrosophilus labii]|uniref:hypothetical protein n=1 Tax=Nitrosophilus labii TaxID=2706014 RepID=UPI001656B305|nr:hypothetical protein [Nitrosophilus labii]